VSGPRELARRQSYSIGAVEASRVAGVKADDEVVVDEPAVGESAVDEVAELVKS